MTEHARGLVLAVHPTSRGFGWAVFEDPLSPVDWGLVRMNLKRRAQCLARYERLLNRYKPKAVAFEQFHERPARRGDRIQDLCQQMVTLAGERGIYTPIYDRDTIRHCFEASGARTRRGIAISIAERIEVFRQRLPRERRRWDSEDVRQSLFDAVALALTYFSISRERRS